ncbi:MAG: hypothetical protein NT029_17955 [Armatimonadetes bacterium]|nr:hypothetical protein [Armatimonadota bacterium]
MATRRRTIGSAGCGCLGSLMATAAICAAASIVGFTGYMYLAFATSPYELGSGYTGPDFGDPLVGVYTAELVVAWIAVWIVQRRRGDVSLPACATGACAALMAAPIILGGWVGAFFGPAGASLFMLAVRGEESADGGAE